MPLNTSKLENDIKKSVDYAAKEAYLAMVKASTTIPEPLTSNGAGIAQFAQALQQAQALAFGKKFGEVLAPRLSKNIEDYIKNADVKIDGIDSLFQGVMPVPQDGGASLLSQIIIKAQSFAALTKNGSVR